MQNSLRSDSCIFAPDADSCELRVSRHPANAIRETLFPELVFIRPERTGNGMFSLGTRGGPQTISRCGPPLVSRRTLWNLTPSGEM